MAKDPAFLFYPKDWLEGTAEMLPIEKGIYIDFLCYHHQKGSLPTDEKRLAILSKLSFKEFKEIWETLSLKFIEQDGRLVNEKLLNVIEDRKSISKKNKVNGNLAALLKKNNLTKSQYKFYQEQRKSIDYDSIEDENITEWCTNWLTNCLGEWSKSIAIEDAIENKDKDNKLILDSNISEEEKDFKMAFNEFKEMRKKIKSPLTSHGEDLIKKKLKELSNNDINIAIQILNQSTMNSWKGVFELKNEVRKQYERYN